MRPRGWRLSCRAAHRAELLGVVMRSGGDCCNERSTGQGSSAGRVRVCGVWRAVVAKTLLNSGKSTIIGGLRVRFGPLGMTDGDDTGTVFSFPQVTRLLWFFCGMASAGSRPSGRCNHRLSSICPSLTPFFQQAGLKTVRRGGFGVVLCRIRMRWRVLLEAPRHDQGRYGAFRHHDLRGVWRIGCCGFDQGRYGAFGRHDLPGDV